LRSSRTTVRPYPAWSRRREARLRAGVREVSANAPGVVETARACLANGASAITAIDSVGPALRFDLASRRPRLGGYGWLSDGRSFPSPSASLPTSRAKRDAPSSDGGRRDADDAVEMLYAGQPPSESARRPCCTACRSRRPPSGPVGAPCLAWGSGARAKRRGGPPGACRRFGRSGGSSGLEIRLSARPARSAEPASAFARTGPGAARKPSWKRTAAAADSAPRPAPQRPSSS